MDDKAECIFNEQVHVKEEEDNIKEEPEWEDNAGLRGISAAAARAGLYAKHEVKDELVLGPESVQPPDIAFRLYACQASAARAQPVLRDCVARPECSADALRPERHIANNADVGKQVHSNANIHTEKETYVCDICNKRFALKTQLVEHVMIHIHQEPEQEEVRVADNACQASAARAQPVLRDCVARPETHVANNADVGNQVHSNANIHTEKETYVCDICNKRFALKTPLVEHVMIHIHQEPEQEEIRVADNARAPKAREHPALRDCVVRLERLELVDLEAGRDERLASRAGRDTDIEKEIHGNIDVNTEEETYICDTCNKWFPRKSQLVDHVMSHIQRPENGRGAGSARGGRGEGLEPARDGRGEGQEPAQGGRGEGREPARNGRGEGQELARGGRGEGREPARNGRGEGREPARDGRGEGREPARGGWGEGREPARSGRGEGREPARAGRGEGREPTHAQDCRHACLICYKDFRAQSQLKCHERIHTGERPFCCGICKQKFTELTNLKSHERIHTGEKPYSCGICTKKFAWLSSLKSHGSTHSGEKPFYCRICKQKFKQSSHLKRHERTHTGERPFCCGICKQKFAQLITLKRHERIHTGERPFCCGICKQKFAWLSSLKSHGSTHSGERPFPCGICKQKFTRLHHLKRHELTHTGEKPFACDMCKKQFTRLRNLKEHKDRIHADRKPFCCDICQKRFEQKTTLVGHIRRHSTAKPR